MSIILDSGSPIPYTFPSSFSIDPPPWSLRLNELERAYKHGSVITGDEMVKTRPLRVWGTLVRTNESAYQTALDSMEGACYVASTLHASQWWPNRFLRVRCRDFTREDYPTLFSGPIDILFRVTDPFWYSTSQSQDSQNNRGSSFLTTIVNTGQIEVSPVIHVRVATGTITSVTMQNISDNNRLFTYGTAANPRTMTVPRGFRVTCSTGEVHRWSGAAYFEDLAGFIGTFYRLQPGANWIILTVATPDGGTVNITHYWRVKWLG